jgi:hypothetical protein
MPVFLDTRGRTKVAIGICARCSVKYPYDELSPDPNYPGLYVCPDGCKDEFDPYRLPARETEDITLEHARPDVAIDSPGPSPNLVADPLDGITAVGFRTTWQPNTPYARAASVTPQNINDPAVELPQQWFVCLTAGTSGATPPDWPTSPGVLVEDGTAVWINYGLYPN